MLIGQTFAAKAPVTNWPSQNGTNERPIIGILDQHYQGLPDYKYIMGAYVKFIEQSGGRVIAIPTDADNESLIEIVDSLNGIVFPGGNRKLLKPNGRLSKFSRAGKLILDRVKQLNDLGIYYPVWAICQGFQQIATIEAPHNDTIAIKEFDAYDLAGNVTFQVDPRTSNMYKDMPDHLIKALENEEVAYKLHNNGLHVDVFKKFAKRFKDYRIIATSTDRKGIEYVATFEHKKYPIYAHQYHTEKSPYLFVPKLKNIPRSQHTFELEAYYSNFFVNECRKNLNSFKSYDDEARLLIHNYQTRYNKNSTLGDIFLIPK